MKYVKEFCKRGAMFCGGGPMIWAIVLLCIQASGTVTMLTVDEAVLGVLSTLVMAFIAAGISMIYTVENLPYITATLIHLVVLYADYLGLYLLNGWIPSRGILIFTVVFIVVFLIIAVIVYCSIKNKVKKLNSRIRA